MMKPTGVSTSFAWRAAADATDAVQLVPEGQRVRLVSVWIAPVSRFNHTTRKTTYVLFKNGNASADTLYTTIGSSWAPYVSPVITFPGTGILFDNGIYMTCDTGPDGGPLGLRSVTINYQGTPDGTLVS